MDKSSQKNEKTPKVKINVKDRLEDDTIDLSLSELTEVPVREIAGIKRVTILDLSNNKLFSLGKNFATLTHIVKLDLSKNQIKYLPEDFGKLRNLRHLDLYNNRIEHLPLSFGDLQNLRYLDLKANPLAVALAKIVGPCLTSKDCRESARNTVQFLAQMQVQVEKAKEKLQDENNDAKIEEIEDVKKIDNQKPKKKKNKNKSKKNKNENQSPKANSTKTTPKTELVDANSYDTEVKSRSVFKTLFIFFFLLGVNIVMLYIVTVKSPEIAEKLVGLIPPQYHDLIVTKTEDLRLNFLKISDWLQNFKTPTPMPSS